MTDGETGQDAPNGLVAGRYRLVRRLGKGGTSTVWEATDERLRRPVTLTMVKPPSGSTEDHGIMVGRAMREARLAARLEHPNAVRVYDVIQHNGEPCLVTEFVASRPLSDILAEPHTLPEHEVSAMGAQVAAALAAAHAAGIVHRDVTPADILVAEDGTARITDVGIAHTGTPSYVAPEVAGVAEPGYASDVYSLGATLYAALEGAPPSVPVQPPRQAGALTPLLLRMLAPDPRARPTMAAVADQLGRSAAVPDAAPPAYADEAVVTPAVPAGPTGPTSSRPRRRLGIVVAAVVVAVALVVVGIVLLRTRGGNEPAAAPAPQPGSTTSTSAPAPTTAPPATSASQGPASADQLAAVVSRYYSLVPGNLDAAFALLTTDYQTRVAGGRQAYRRFWDGYSAVTATDVTATPPSTVTATVTYTTKSGQVVRERTTFGLVDDGGVLKIGSSTVTGRS